jgi:hypothetical protein
MERGVPNKLASSCPWLPLKDFLAILETRVQNIDWATPYTSVGKGGVGRL